MISLNSKAFKAVMNKFGLSDTNHQRGRQTRSNRSQISQGQACQIERKTKTDPETIKPQPRLIGTLRYTGRGRGGLQPEVSSQVLEFNLHKCHATCRPPPQWRRRQSSFWRPLRFQRIDKRKTLGDVFQSLSIKIELLLVAAKLEA